ncbi:MAG: hypothetical protein AAF577_06770 [Pseudomonadota bacterium]
MFEGLVLIVLATGGLIYAVIIYRRDRARSRDRPLGHPDVALSGSDGEFESPRPRVRGDRDGDFSGDGGGDGGGSGGGGD